MKRGRDVKREVVKVKHVATVAGREFPLVEDDHGTLRFPENPIINDLLDAPGSGLDMNEIWRRGYDREHLMAFYRDIGYSLFGFWEVFGWDMNTEDPVEILLDGKPYPS